MVEFWSHTVAQIDWQVSQFQLFPLVLLLVWCWLIWPAQDVAALIDNRQLQVRLLLSLTSITALWLMNANILQGLHVHFLGLVTLMLMFGWRLSSIVVLLPTAFFSVFVLKQPLEFGAYGLIAMDAVILGCFIFYSIIFHRLPHHLFVFIFCAGFLNAAVSVVLHFSFWSVWLWSTTHYDWSMLVDNYLLLIPLIGFPEALLNGMALTLLVVYRPEWLYDYSDRHYLYQK